MCYLRSLALVIFLFNHSAIFAITQNLSARLNTESREGAVDITDLNRKYSTNRTEEEITYRIDNWNEYWSLESRFAVSQPDYSSVLVRDRTGVERKLSDITPQQNEMTSALTLGFAKGSHMAIIGWQGFVSASPFASHSAQAMYRKSFFSNATAISCEGTYLQQTQPQSFFTDLSFKTVERPRNIHALGGALAFEQIFTERLKTKTTFRLSQRIEERPLNASLEWQNGYAISNRWFAELGLQYRTEMTSQELKNDRGYFIAYGPNLRLTVEPWYDFLLSVSYALLIERENDPRTGRESQVASDQYGLGISYFLRQVEWHVLSSYFVTNTQVRGLKLSGGVTWKL